MTAEVLLSRLDHVRPYADGYRAQCPAHEGTSRGSLAITDKGDRVLVHCFGGCAVADVLGAVGLTTADLFDDSSHQNPMTRAERKRYGQQAKWGAALGVLVTEARVVWVAARTMQFGESLTAKDLERLNIAMDRIQEAGEVMK